MLITETEVVWQQILWLVHVYEADSWKGPIV